MTFRGHIRNGAVILDDAPASLPEGAAVEVSIVAGSHLPPQRPPVTSLEQLQSQLLCDPFDGADPAELLRELRSRPWRASTQEPLE